MSEKKIAYKPLIDFQSFEIAERLIAVVYSMEDDGIEIVYPGMKMPSAASVKGDAIGLVPWPPVEDIKDGLGEDFGEYEEMDDPAEMLREYFNRVYDGVCDEETEGYLYNLEQAAEAAGFEVVEKDFGEA